jgi:hypothetical protein
MSGATPVVEVQTEVLLLVLFETPRGFRCQRLRPGQTVESAECGSVFDVQAFFGRGPTACQLYRDWLRADTTVRGEDAAA